MAKTGQNGGMGHDPDDRLKARLDELDRRLGPTQKQGDGLSEGERRRRSSALGKAFRLSTELVAGVAVGGFMGWGLDKAFGTSKPYFFVSFLVLGVAAGLLNAVRTARQMGREQ